MINFKKFKNITNYDIKSFFNDVKDFIDNNYPSIVGYYDGGILDDNSFFKLDNLIKETTIIEPLFNIYSEQLGTVDMWEVLDIFSDIQVKLLTIKNTGKWLRSSRLTNYDNKVKVNRVLGQNETFENVAESLGYINEQDDWKGILLENKIIEEDYTIEGGVMFNVSLQNNFNIKIDNLVDNMIGDNILGKDIYRKITFENDDLKIVIGKTAMKQSFDIKLSLRKNSIPEFPEYGMDEELIGSNVASVSYPSLFRDIMSIFKNDKRWSEVSIIDLFREKDALFLKIGAKSILNNQLTTNIQI